MKKISYHLKEKSSRFRAEFRKQTTTALITAFGLVIALSWQSVIKKYFEGVAPPGIVAKYPYLADVYTAILVTLFGVIGILLISRWANPPHPEQ